MFKTVAIAIAAATLSLIAAGSAEASMLAALPHSKSAPAISYIVAKGPTLAPFAHVVFCTQNPADCAASTGPEEVALDAARQTELDAVNRAVNAAIRPVNDAAGTDVWTIEPKSGDCDDYAVTKRHELIARGWPEAALRLAVVVTAMGEGHAVLVAHTDKGDLVLDNRTTAIRPFDKTGLKWLKIQSGANPHAWLAI